jgi:membrane dipeptidase
MKNRFRLLFGLLLIFVSCQQLSEEEKLMKKALKIHHRIFTVDSHTDTPLSFVRGSFDIGKSHNSRKDGSKIDFPRMKQGGLDAAFFAVFIGQGPRKEESNKKALLKAEEIFDSVYSVVGRNDDVAGIALTPDEALKLTKAGKSTVFLGIENGYPLGHDVSLVKHFYDRGACYITLCHTKNNDICDSSNDSAVFNGLSEFGEKVVAEMNKTGMMIDVSHISDSSFYDVIRLSKYPVIASHSSARAICDSPRNLTDDMLKKLAEKGGVAQVCLLSDYVKKMPENPLRDSAMDILHRKYPNWSLLPEEELKKAWMEWNETNLKFPPNLATVSDLADHIDHIVKVAGIDHVGIGSDFDGGGCLADCFDVTEMPNITIELVRRGYSETDIRKIWGGNLMRVMREVQNVGGKS